MSKTHITPLVVALANKGPDELDIHIYDVIGAQLFSDGVRAKDVLAKVSAAKSAKIINIRINSAGGDVFEGTAIFNTLAASSARKVVTIDGLAASMASLIAMVGDEIIMPDNALMMVHNPTAFTGGTSAELRKTADTLEKARGNLANIYSARTKQPLASVLKAMDEETWMTAAEAMKLGYATRVTAAVKMVAQWDLSMCARIPDQVRKEIAAIPRVSLRALYAPENRFLVANFKHWAAAAIGKELPVDPDEQRAVLQAYLTASATGVGIVNDIMKRKADAARNDMESSGVPLMPPPSAA